MRLALTVVAACLAGAGVAVLVLGTDDNTRPADTAPQATTTTTPDVTSRLDSGEVGVIVTEDSLRLTTRTGVRERGLLSLAIDNRATHRIEVVLARDTRPPTFVAGSIPLAFSSTLNQFQVSPGRYVVIAREPTEDEDGPISGFAQTSLRVR